jgi:hypothetical protein
LFNDGFRNDFTSRELETHWKLHWRNHPNNLLKLRARDARDLFLSHSKKSTVPCCNQLISCEGNTLMSVLPSWDFIRLATKLQAIARSSLLSPIVTKLQRDCCLGPSFGPLLASTGNHKTRIFTFILRFFFLQAMSIQRLRLERWKCVLGILTKGDNFS